MQCIPERGSARLFLQCSYDMTLWVCCTTGVDKGDILIQCTQLEGEGMGFGFGLWLSGQNVAATLKGAGGG